jgi:hypothetical protein
MSPSQLLIRAIVFGALLMPASSFASMAASTQWLASGPADWSAPSSWTNGFPGVDDTAEISGDGVAVISTDTAGPYELFLGGAAGAGAVEQTGGVWTPRLIRFSDIPLADINGPFLGRIAIEAGAVFKPGGIYGSNGLIEQSGGLFQMSQLTVAGTQRQSGGTLNVTYAFTTYPGSRFEVSGNSIVLLPENVTIAGDVLQTGGQLGAKYQSSLSSGVYRVEGGVSRLGIATIGDGARLEIAGGEVVLDKPFVAPASYGSIGMVNVSGGELALVNSIEVDSGPMHFEAGSWTLDVRGGIASLQNSVLDDVSQAILEKAPGTLTILPAGVSEADFGASFGAGLTHTAGTPLFIRLQDEVFGLGVITDPLRVRGQIVARDTSNDSGRNPAIEVRNGIQVFEGAAKLGAGSITVSDLVSGLFAGDLRARNLTVGTPGSPGRFEQAGGTFTDEENTSQSLTIRLGAANGRGEYLLRAGSLTAGDLEVGRFGQGLFRQTGGQANFYYDNAIWGQGEYQLTGGSLESGELAVLGRFVQTGGRHINRQAADIGEPNTHGVYELTNGEHIVEGELAIARFDSSKGSYLIGANGILRADKINLNGPGQGLVRVDGGEINAEVLELGRFERGRSQLEIASADAAIRVSKELHLGPTGWLLAADDATIDLNDADLRITATNPINYRALNHMRLHFSGEDAFFETLEVAGADLGPDPIGYVDNFALKELRIEQSGAGGLRLEEVVNNTPGSEALYVQELVLGPSAILDLNGKTLYYGFARIDASATVRLNGGSFQQLTVPEPTTTALVGLVSIVLHIGQRRRLSGD